MIYIKKIKISILFFLLFGFTAGCGNTVQNEIYKNITAKESFALIQSENILILDVRTQTEYTQGHIKNSVLIPVQVLKTDYIKIKGFENTKIIIYCRSGNRSVTASKILSNYGFKKLYNMTGGIKDWAKKKLPVQTAP